MADSVGVPEGDTVAVNVLEGEEPELGVPVPLPELLGVAEGVALVVCVRDPLRLLVAVAVRVPLEERVPEAEAVNVGEVLGLEPGEGVSVPVPELLGVPVGLREGDGVGEGVAEGVREVDRVRDSEGVAVLERVWELSVAAKSDRRVKRVRSRAMALKPSARRFRGGGDGGGGRREGKKISRS